MALTLDGMRHEDACRRTLKTAPEGAVLTKVNELFKAQPFLPQSADFLQPCFQTLPAG